MILSDYHIHSSFSADSDAAMESMVEKAIELGLESICFTDHMDLDYPTQYGIDFTFDLDDYLKKINTMKDLYQNKIKILQGIELGLMPHLVEPYKHLLQDFNFDFIIGSSHIVNNLDPYATDYWENCSEEEGYRAYFKSIIQNLNLFQNIDTYGHIDYIVRYGPNKNKYYTFDKYSDLLEEILHSIIQKEKCLEVNTAGFKYGLEQPHPHIEVLQRYRDLGGESITIGSDAHKPEHLCFDFKRTRELLIQLGFKYYTVFEDRKPIKKKL